MPFWTAAFFFLAEPTPFLAVLCTVSEYGFISLSLAFPVFVKRVISRLLTTAVSDLGYFFYDARSINSSSSSSANVQESGFIDSMDGEKEGDATVDTSAAAASLPTRPARPVADTARRLRFFSSSLLPPLYDCLLAG